MTVLSDTSLSLLERVQREDVARCRIQKMVTEELQQLAELDHAD